MNIEEIMRPYFEKQEEIKQNGNGNFIVTTYEKEAEGLNQQKVFLELRLDRLRTNKEQEIEEYVKNAVSDKPDFYTGYGAMIRKDLEQSYLNREQELENQITSINEQLQEIEKNIQGEMERVQKFHNVDVRELCELKGSLRLPLNQAKKELEYKLEETKLNFDNVMLKLARFEYVYDENHQVLNGEDCKKLFEESDRLIEVKADIQRQLEQIKEYLSLTELTPEEIAVSMMSMTPWEKDEYNRRKIVAGMDVIPLEEEQDSVEYLGDIDLDGENTIEVENNSIDEDINQVDEDTLVVDDNDQDLLESNENDVISSLQFDGDFGDELTEENVYADFITSVYDEVMDCCKKQRSIKLNNGILSSNLNTSNHYGEAGLISDGVKLPNGQYIHKKDIHDALDNYVKKNKGRLFVVEGFDKTFEVNKKTVRTVKNFLRECSAIKLLSDKKLGFFDVKRVFGKEKAGKYNREANGSMDTTLPNGEYINMDEFASNLKELFTQKSSKWLERLRRTFKRNSKKNDLMDEEDVFDLDEDYEFSRTR